jgi:hypothetical protein
MKENQKSKNPIVQHTEKAENCKAETFPCVQCIQLYSIRILSGCQTAAVSSGWITRTTTKKAGSTFYS